MEEQQFSHIAPSTFPHKDFDIKSLKDGTIVWGIWKNTSYYSLTPSVCMFIKDGELLTAINNQKIETPPYLMCEVEKDTHYIMDNPYYKK
jgi:hypothetical protein